MFPLPFLLIFSAFAFLIGAFTIGDQETKTSIKHEHNLATSTVSIKDYRFEGKNVRETGRTDDNPKKRNKRIKTLGIRDLNSEEEYDYFYEYESSDYRKESRSFTGTGTNDKDVFSCPGNFNGTYPIADRCDKYLICIFGQSLPQQCAKGLQFDLITKRCDVSRNSVCNYACPEENGYFGIPGDCNGFFRCEDGRPRYETCPPHRHWDFIRELCVDEQFSTCPMKCGFFEGVKPYFGDCESYVICKRKESHYRRCPDGTRFDPEQSMCVSSENACVSNPKLVSKNLPGSRLKRF